MKNFMKLFESEIEKAEVTLAVRDISDTLQKMASQLSGTSVDDIPAVVERIKFAHGVNKGNDFGKKISEKLNALIQQVLETKSAIDDMALVLSGDASESDMTDMDMEPDFDEPTGPETDMDMEPEMDDLGADLDKEMDDEGPLGRRVKTESYHPAVKRLLEKCDMKKKKVVVEMYKRGGKDRKKVIDLAKSVK